MSQESQYKNKDIYATQLTKETYSTTMKETKQFGHNTTSPLATLSHKPPLPAADASLAKSCSCYEANNNTKDNASVMKSLPDDQSINQSNGSRKIVDLKGENDNNDEGQYRLSKRRWIILLGMCIFGFLNGVVSIVL